MSPFIVKNTIDGDIPVPCGKCYNCLRRRTSGWSFRLMKEYERSKSAHFLTLTYDTAHVPITSKGFMTLKKSDLQNFFKRLRKLTKEKIKYYACGEYGGQTYRPHYHIIIFNAEIKHIVSAWTLNGNLLGTYHFGDVNEASVGYTLKYMCKAKKIPLHKNDDRQKEFALMSKGLGENYITPNKIKWHKSNPHEKMFLTLKDGKKIAMPRYYKNKLFTESELKQANFILISDMKKQEAMLTSTIMNSLHCSPEYAVAELATLQTNINNTKSKQNEQRNQKGRNKI